MSEENVEAYKRAVEAANRRDLEALLEEFDPEVEWYPQVVGLGSEVYRGAEGIRELFADMEATISEAVLQVGESATSATVSFPLAASAPTAARAALQPKSRSTS